MNHVILRTTSLSSRLDAQKRALTSAQETAQRAYDEINAEELDMRRAGRTEQLLAFYNFEGREPARSLAYELGRLLAIKRPSEITGWSTPYELLKHTPGISDNYRADPHPIPFFEQTTTLIERLVLFAHTTETQQHDTSVRSDGFRRSQQLARLTWDIVKLDAGFDMSYMDSPMRRSTNITLQELADDYKRNLVLAHRLDNPYCWVADAARSFFLLDLKGEK